MNISDKRAKAGNCIFRCHGGQPDSYPYCRYYVRPAPYGGAEPKSDHDPPARRLFPPYSGVYSRKNAAFRTGERTALREVVFSKKKTASLRASGAQTERLFFSAEGPGCFTGRPWAVFSLELVAYLERAAYAFPRPRIAGGAKQEGDRNLF